MSNVTAENISASFARMRARHKKRVAENVAPSCACAYCRSTYWEQTEDNGWYCFTCGNRGYWQNGEFIQHNSK